MPKRNEDIYGTHKFLNKPALHKSLALALVSTNESFGTTATLRQVKCAISRGMIERARRYARDGSITELVNDYLRTIKNYCDLSCAFGWADISVPWIDDSSHLIWWCRLSRRLRYYYHRNSHHNTPDRV